MARFGYTFSGGAPVMKRYKLNATSGTAGVIVRQGATTNAGLIQATTTAATDAVGLTTDTGTYTTTQSTTMTEGLVTVIVNPDLVSKWLLSSTAANGGALVTTTNTTASTGGTLITITTGDPAPNSPQMIDGTALCIFGNNAAQPNNPMANAVITVGSTTNAVNTGSRAITASAATTATVVVPYPNTIAVGDIFLLVSTANHLNSGNVKIQFTTNLDQARADIAVGTGAEMRAVELLWGAVNGTGAGSDVRSNSYVLAVADDHVFNVTT